MPNPTSPNSNGETINEVILNGDVILSTRGNTVTPETLVQGETAQMNTGESITGELDPVTHGEFDELKREVEEYHEQQETIAEQAYMVTDDEADIDENDFIPFNDVSDGNKPKKKFAFTSLIEKLKSFFATKSGDNIDDVDAFRENIHTLEWLGTDIPNNSDMNTYKTAGNYRVVSDASAQTISNLPLALCGKVIVFDNGNGGLEQFYFPNHSPRIFFRTWWSNAWSTWKELGEGGGDSEPHTYEIGTDIPVNSDLNNYKTAGVYMVRGDSDATTITNIPEQMAGKLIVSYIVPSMNFIHQFYYSDTNHIYIRMYSNWNTTWTTWQDITSSGNSKPHTYEMGTAIPANSDINNYTTEGVYYVSGGTIAETISNLPIAGAGKLIVMDRDTGARLFQIFIASSNNIYIRDMDNAGVFYAWKNISRSHTFEAGISIPANSDLNTYTTEGVYKIAPDSTAQTISNMPKDSSNVIRGGKLIVNKGLSSNETYVAQIFLNNVGHIYKRNTTNNGTTWSDWQQLATTDVSVLWAQNNVIGAKNLFNYAHSLGNSDVGLTTTYNNNGSITISGTTTGEYLYPNNKFYYDLSPNTYIFSVGTSHSSMRLQVYYKATSDAGWTNLVNTANVSEVKFTLPNTYYCVWIRINIGTGVTLSSPITIYPMLRLASIKDGTFEPYAETNQNLTDSLQSEQHYLSQVSPTRRIQANEDLNNYTASGTYQCANANIATTLSNCPVNQSFKLVVDRAYIRSESEITQRITCYNLAGSTDWVRTRQYGATSWGEWKHIASYQDISPATIGNGYASASISGSAITATISGFQLRAGVIVSMAFSNEVAVDCTINISNTGAKGVRYWADQAISAGKPIKLGLNTFMYDGTYYRLISIDRTPTVHEQSYVADTSGNVNIDWGYGVNRTQIKFNLASNKLLWNYRKNSSWRGDVYIADYDDIVHQTLGIAILDNADFNSYTAKGIYNVSTNARALTLSNRPCGRAGKLVVERIGGDSYIVQTYNTYNGDTTSYDGVYRRTSYNGGTNWTEWIYFAPIRDSSGNKFLYLNGETTTANDKYVGIQARILDTTTGKDYGNGLLKAYQDHASTPYGFNVVVGGGGSLFLGGGEGGQAHYDGLAKPYTGENVLITADGSIYLQANANTIANRVGFMLDANGNLIPCKADIKTDNIGNIGWSDRKLSGVYTYKLNGQSIENVIVAKTSGITPTTLDDIPVNTAGWVTLSASLSPVGVEKGYIYSCYKEGNGNRKAIHLMRIAFDKHSENCWMNGYDGSTWTGWIPLTNQKKTYVGTCDTAGGTKDKVATVDSNFALMKGVRVSIKFTNSNSYSNATASPITLNVNSTGAKNIWYWTTHSGAGNTGTNPIPYGSAGRYINYYYDGTYWVWDGMSGEANDNNRKAFYGTCATAGDQQIKVVTISDTSGWELRAGTIVGVKFSNSNTYNATADNKIQLNVNSTGGKPIYYGQSYPTGTNTTIFGYANRVHYYMYDGANWCWLSHGADNDGNNRKSFYGTCSTEAGTSAKVVTLSDTNGWELRAGTVVGIKFSNSNTASNVTLNVNNSGAKSIYYNTAVYTGTSNAVCGVANRTNFYMYNGSQWVFINNGLIEADTFTSARCDTAGDTSAKVATCHNYVLLSKSQLHIIMSNANTAKSALTLNVNGKGAKPIYINGSASSSSNYTLPAGSYLIYYNGTNYYFRTDGKITCAGTVTV